MKLFPPVLCLLTRPLRLQPTPGGGGGCASRNGENKKLLRFLLRETSEPPLTAALSKKDSARNKLSDSLPFWKKNKYEAHRTIYSELIHSLIILLTLNTAPQFSGRFTLSVLTAKNFPDIISGVLRVLLVSSAGCILRKAVTVPTVWVNTKLY